MIEMRAHARAFVSIEIVKQRFFYYAARAQGKNEKMPPVRPLHSGAEYRHDVHTGSARNRCYTISSEPGRQHLIRERWCLSEEDVCRKGRYGARTN